MQIEKLLVITIGVFSFKGYACKTNVPLDCVSTKALETNLNRLRQNLQREKQHFSRKIQNLRERISRSSGCAVDAVRFDQVLENWSNQSKIPPQPPNRGPSCQSSSACVKRDLQSLQDSLNYLQNQSEKERTAIEQLITILTEIVEDCKKSGS